jgi:hypothetical protein
MGDHRMQGDDPCRVSNSSAQKILVAQQPVQRKMPDISTDVWHVLLSQEQRRLSGSTRSPQHHATRDGQSRDRQDQTKRDR